ncbi:hypothetical protein [Moorena sp. SIO3H5]|uniref:hypothetical protein n=1 Tax=Moorena sp. SIO3H5 TaxID=2607834 RepID=UPI0013BDD42F|nr:hypothetical protein [Moorena sp. SIO3H5]NEO67985.1 hypothetical protein [Moorena sp. SIO3H5]
MVAIPDKKGNVVTPMVLTISNQNQLYLVRKDDESKSGDGWKLIDLSQAFKGIDGKPLPVHAHSAAWTEDDKITIAVAVDDDSSDGSRVFVAYDLSSCESDWENIEWKDCGTRQGTLKGVRVVGIRVLDEGDGVWTVVLAGDSGSDEVFYLLRSNNIEQQFDLALIFNTALTLKEILDFEVAVLPLLGCGIAVLGNHNGTIDLSFRLFPRYKDGRFDSSPPVQPLPCPDGANVLETGLTKKVADIRRLGPIYGSDIYVGGQGVHQIKARDIYQVKASKKGEIVTTVVTPPDLAPNVRDLIVGDAPDGSASVWSLLQNGDLNVVKKAADQDWGEPLRLRVGVQAIAPVHGDKHMTTSLLVVYGNGQAGFLCREESQGIWQERPLTVADPEEVTPITCYGTNLRVLSDSSLPKPNVKVTVTASVLSSVVINGKAVFIGPELPPIKTETDFNGSVMLYDRVRSFTPAIYRFQIEGFDQCIDVNPASGVHERFKTIKADELRKATISTKEGEEPEPLLPESFRTGADKNKVDMLAGSLNQMSSLANSANGVVAGISLVNCDQPFSSTLRTDTVPDDYRWGIQADEHGVKTIVGNAINSVINAVENVGKFFKNVGEGIVDFFEGLINGVREDGIKGGITFVIHKTKEAAKSVFKFVCKIGDKIKSFVLNTLEQVGGAIKWLWKQCKTGLEKVWNFLKFLFNWDDILRVRDVLVRATDVAIDRIKDSIEPMKKGVESTFDELIETVENWKSPENRRPKEDESSSLSSVVKKNTDDDTQKKMDLVNGNSAISWIFEKFQNIANEVIEIKTPDPDITLQNALAEFLEGTFKTAWDELSQSFKQMEVIFSNAFKDDLPDVEDISIGWIFGKINSLIEEVGSEALGTALRIIKGVILKLFDLIQDLISFGRNLMFAEIGFPFIEKLLKWITGKSVSTSFKLIDAVALLVAVPTTITYKILFGEAPIKEGELPAIPHNKVVRVQSFIMPDIWWWRIFSVVSAFAWVLVFPLLVGILGLESIILPRAETDMGGYMTRKLISVRSVAVGLILMSIIGVIILKDPNDIAIEKILDAENNGAFASSCVMVVMLIEIFVMCFANIPYTNKGTSGCIFAIAAFALVKEIWFKLYKRVTDEEPTGKYKNRYKFTFATYFVNASRICASLAAFDPEPSSKALLLGFAGIFRVPAFGFGLAGAIKGKPISL